MYFSLNHATFSSFRQKGTFWYFRFFRKLPNRFDYWISYDHMERIDDKIFFIAWDLQRSLIIDLLIYILWSEFMIILSYSDVLSHKLTTSFPEYKLFDCHDDDGWDVTAKGLWQLFVLICYDPVEGEPWNIFASFMTSLWQLVGWAMVK